MSDRAICPCCRQRVTTKDHRHPALEAIAMLIANRSASMTPLELLDLLGGRE